MNNRGWEISEVEKFIQKNTPSRPGNLDARFAVCRIYGNIVRSSDKRTRRARGVSANIWTTQRGVHPLRCEAGTSDGLHLIRREDAPLRAMKDLQQLVVRALRIPEFRFRDEPEIAGLSVEDGQR